ncbi:spore protease YyaC [Virgibacillus xinjiangensis]|uniref:Spore protease YyaC n=1 Tax=Virgibacillus xinjiangensis TaxID=393090 RepID=A0ABV7CXW6_9BACI
MNLKKRFGLQQENFRMLHTNPDLQDEMLAKIFSWIPKQPKECVVVCIGTDRSTGDALGPLTGTYLTEMQPKNLTIYGTLKYPVHATNLSDYIQLIGEAHQQSFIIAIDAGLGKSGSVGYLIAGKGSIKPGAALNKPLPPVGDVHITGVVNVGGFMEASVLQNTRLSIVSDMAHKTADLLSGFDRQLSREKFSPSLGLKSNKKGTLHYM